MIKIEYKPLSVNQAWQGRRFKTDAYKKYQRDITLLLPKLDIGKPPYKIYFEFGFSNTLSDWDNPIKPLQDILQKKYNFDDKDIFEAEIKKVLVKRGKDYFKFKIEQIC